MRHLAAIMLMLAASSAMAGEMRTAKGATLCKAGEQALWSCTSKSGSGKMASLCASNPVTDATGYVQYRFGTAQKVEFTFPKSRENTQKQFTYTRYTRPLVTHLSVKFTHEGMDYMVTHDSNEEEKPFTNTSTIEVEPESDKPTIIACREQGSLMNLEDLVPNKDELHE